MDWPVYFDYELCLGTVEIDHEPLNGMLAAKLETSYLPISHTCP